MNNIKTITCVRALKHADKKEMDTRKYFIIAIINGKPQKVACNTYSKLAEELNPHGVEFLTLVDIDGTYLVNTSTLELTKTNGEPNMN